MKKLLLLSLLLVSAMTNAKEQPHKSYEEYGEMTVLEFAREMEEAYEAARANNIATFINNPLYMALNDEFGDREISSFIIGTFSVLSYPGNSYKGFIHKCTHLDEVAKRQRDTFEELCESTMWDGIFKPAEKVLKQKGYIK